MEEARWELAGVVTSVFLSADKAKLIVGASDHTVCLCDVATDDHSDVSTSLSSTSLAASYASTLTEVPDLRRAAYMLVALACLVVVFVVLLFVSRCFDVRDRRRRHKRR